MKNKNRYLIWHFLQAPYDEMQIKNVDSCFEDGASNGVTMGDGNDIYLFLDFKRVCESKYGGNMLFEEIYEAKGALYFLTTAENVMQAYNNYIKSLEIFNDRRNKTQILDKSNTTI